MHDTNSTRGTRRAVAALLAWLLSVCPVFAQQSDDTKSAAVVFVCEHGSVKSLVAASLFNQIAERRGIALRAVSRGMTPDPAVPSRIVDALRADDVDVSEFRPQSLTSRDVDQSIRTITIGIELTGLRHERSASIEKWQDVPASSDYALMRQSLLRHIDQLLRELENSRR